MANTGTIFVNVRTSSDMYKRRDGINYFRSEKFLQEYMLGRNIITKTTYLVNILKRLLFSVSWQIVLGVGDLKALQEKNSLCLSKSRIACPRLEAPIPPARKNGLWISGIKDQSKVFPVPPPP